MPQSDMAGQQLDLKSATELFLFLRSEVARNLPRQTGLQRNADRSVRQLALHRELHPLSELDKVLGSLGYRAVV